MKAVVCRSWGDPSALRVEEIDARRPGPGEVRISVKASAVNFADTLILAGKYQVKPQLPYIPGLELAGEVIECGVGVSSARPGDRVLVWARYGGGFAEEFVARASTLVPIPATMDFATAAGFFIGHGTAYFALTRRAGLAAGETLLVTGAGGGVGLAAVEVGNALGARVIACASTPEKLSMAAARGADLLVNYSCENMRDSVREYTAGSGVDVVFDAVGGEVFDHAMRSAAWHARILLIGFASGTVPQIPANIVLVKNISIISAVWGAESERDPAFAVSVMGELMEIYRAGRLKPLVSTIYPLSEAPDAIRAIVERRTVGKVVVVP
ncbi:MAG: NADPH:quinone oxidoreductase family protein [Burkholderiaceae bacterium]|nr:NADPH:quinone oxidoreductase family protein [Burkholderiaceae bacterium]